MVLSAQHIKSQLKVLGIRPDKYLGQHFLIDETVLARMIEEAGKFIGPEDTIMEIGPGLGVLTAELVQTNLNVLAVEKDPILAQNLAKMLHNPSNLEVKQADVLKLLTPDFQLPTPWCVIANIPYAITSPLLRRLVTLAHPPHHVLVLVQKETAERMCAQPGNAARGLLSVLLQAYADCSILAHVPAAAFWPEPKVNSAILLLEVKASTTVIDTQFMRVLVAGFSAKRKQVFKSLAGGLQKSPDSIKTALIKHDIDPTRRAETLTLKEWAKLARELV